MVYFIIFPMFCDQGAHITINARTEDDLDEDDVMKKVAKSSGANYSFHKEKARPVEPSGPVVNFFLKILLIFVIGRFLNVRKLL